MFLGLRRKFAIAHSQLVAFIHSTYGNFIILELVTQLSRPLAYKLQRI